MAAETKLAMTAPSSATETPEKWRATDAASACFAAAFSFSSPLLLLLLLLLIRCLFALDCGHGGLPLAFAAAVVQACTSLVFAHAYVVDGVLHRL